MNEIQKQKIVSDILRICENDVVNYGSTTQILGEDADIKFVVNNIDNYASEYTVKINAIEDAKDIINRVFNTPGNNDFQSLGSEADPNNTLYLHFYRTNPPV